MARTGREQILLSSCSGEARQEIFKHNGYYDKIGQDEIKGGVCGEGSIFTDIEDGTEATLGATNGGRLRRSRCTPQSTRLHQSKDER